MKRRTLLSIGAGVAAAGGLAWWQRNSILRGFLTSDKNQDVVISTTPGIDTDMCVLTPEQVEGPYFVQAPIRSNIVEDREGQALHLSLRIVDAETCQPVAGALAEVWHCDAQGRYSAYPEDLARDPIGTLNLVREAGGGHVEPVNDKRYLRGAQVTDDQGLVSFQTIVPGWYEPRVPHIHLKVFVEEQSYLTTQLYFTDELMAELFASHPAYQPFGLSPYNLMNDMVIAQAGTGESLLLSPSMQGETMMATATLGVSTANTA